MSAYKSANILALDILVDGSLTPAKRDRKLAALRHRVMSHGLGRTRCPECGATSTEDNGATKLTDLSYVCRPCGFSFDAVEV